jgi:hypothetical protein
LAVARSRAPTVFLERIRNIRSKNTVLDKSNNGLGLHLYKIADCVRTAFRPYAIGDPRGRVFVRAKNGNSATGRDLSGHV